MKIESRKLMAILLIALMLLLVPTVKALTTKNAHNRGVVVFIGDSNITLAVTNIHWALTWKEHQDNSYTPVFLSRVGSAIRTKDCLEPAGCTTYDHWKIKLGETLPKINADIFVVNLGVNDTGIVGGPSSQGYAYYGQKIDWFMNLLPSNKTVLWTNLPCQIEPPVRLTGCKSVNYALALAQSRWPNLVVLNWATVANPHPEYIVTGDVHYTGAGNFAWTKLVVDALDARLPIPDN